MPAVVTHLSLEEINRILIGKVPTGQTQGMIKACSSVRKWRLKELFSAVIV